MRRVLGVISASLFVAITNGNAVAQKDELQPFLNGRPFVATTTTGSKASFTFHPDGRLERQPISGSLGAGQGTWRRLGQQVCTTFSGFAENCYDFRKTEAGLSVLRGETLVAIWAAAAPASKQQAPSSSSKGAVVDLSGLKAGTYVNSTVRCDQAANASIMKFDGKRFTASRYCALPKDAKQGRTTFTVGPCDPDQEQPEDLPPVQGTYTIKSNAEFSSDRNTYRFCEQASLPDIWRDEQTTASRVLKKRKKEPSQVSECSQFFAGQPVIWRAKGGVVSRQVFSSDGRVTTEMLTGGTGSQVCQWSAEGDRVCRSCGDRAPFCYYVTAMGDTCSMSLVQGGPSVAAVMLESEEAKRGTVPARAVTAAPEPPSDDKNGVFGVTIGMDAARAGQVIEDRLRQFPDVQHIARNVDGVVALTDWGSFANSNGGSVVRIQGRPNPHAHLYSVSANIWYVREPGTGRPLVSKLEMQLSRVDLDDAIKQLSEKLGQGRTYRADWCDTKTSWQRGSVAVEVCRNTPQAIGQLDLVMEDKDFALRMNNAIERQKGSIGRPKF